jgi:hypothetical protein
MSTCHIVRQLQPHEREASNLYNSAACDRVFDAEVDDDVFERTAAAAVEI